MHSKLVSIGKPRCVKKRGEGLSHPVSQLGHVEVHGREFQVVVEKHLSAALLPRSHVAMKGPEEVRLYLLVRRNFINRLPELLEDQVLRLSGRVGRPRLGGDLTAPA